MRRVFAIGETILDIIFENDQPTRAIAGGSVLNSAVSLARAGCDVYLISEIGEDRPAEIIKGFLKDNNVKCDYLIKMNAHTPLALAFLNEQKEASYEFYKDYPKDRFQIAPPLFNHKDIILFGSTFSALPEVRNNLKILLKKAENAGAVIIYDPNVRKPYVNSESFSFFTENLQFADIVRASLPDFAALGINENSYETIKQYACNLIVTNGCDDAVLFTKKFFRTFPVIKVNVKSSIGAGDSFNAGLIFGLIKKVLFKEDLQNMGIELWSDIIDIALRFAKETVNSYDNYIPKGFRL